MLDIFFLSYNEPYADENYDKLLEIVPYARRVNGIKGFAQAHQECARLSFTNNFYVVDSDAVLVPGFDFSFTPSKYIEFWGKPENECICIWQSQNPINDLIYGHGGVKIIPKLPLLGSDRDVIDFTTGFGLNTRVFEKVSNITAFNYDEFSTWRSAFRECAKLSTNLTNEKFLEQGLDSTVVDAILKETQQRLDIWTNVGRDRKFGEYCIHGAIRGMEYGQANKEEYSALKLINDYDWMKNEFNRFFR